MQRQPPPLPAGDAPLPDVHALLGAHTSAAVAITDAERKLVWVNEGFCRLTGHSRAELLGMSPGAMLQGPRTDPAVVAQMREALNAGRPFSGEIINYRKDGQAFWTHLVIDPVYDREGTLTHFTSVQYEITADRRQANLNRVIMRSADIPMVATDPDGTITAINPAAEALTGLNASALLHRQGLEAFISGADRGGRGSRLAEMAAAPPRRAVCSGPDGLSIPVEISTSAMRGPDGCCEGYVLVMRDLSLLESAEAARSRLAQVASNAPAVLYEYRVAPDGQSAFTFVSDAVQEVFELDVAAVLSDIRAAFSRVLPEDLPRLLASSVEATRTLSPWREEFRVALPKGGQRWIRGGSSPRAEPDGSVVFHGFFLDITREREREAAVTELTERLSIATRSGGFGIWEYRPKDGRLIWDAQMFRLYGVDPATFTGTLDDWEAPVHPEDAVRVHAAAEALMVHDAPFDVEFRVKGPHDKTTRWLVGRAHVQRDPSGAPLRVIGINRDITKRKTAELARVEAHDRLDRFFSLALDLLAIATVDGRFLRVNKAWERVLGYPQGELEGRSFLELVHPDDQEATQAAMSVLADGKDVTGFVNRYRARDGGWRNVEWFSNASDGIIYAAARDITEALAREEQLREAKRRAVAANEAKSTFLANMSHEIRTPMNGIVGMAELLLGTRLDAEQRDWVRTIVDSSDNLLRLLDDIIDISRLESGKLPIDITEVPLESLMKELIELFRLRFGAGPVEFVVRLGEGVPPTVRADAGRLRQILTNLLGNAAKFTHYGHVFLDITRRGAALAFSVEDTGIGIPSDRLPSLFEPFEQLDGSVARVYGGSGLGLAISRRLAELLGGSVEAESELGVGSTFTFHLPLGEAAPSRPVAAAPTSRGRVVLAAPSPLGRRVLAELTESCGFSVEAVASLPEAVEAVRRARPVALLAVLDLRDEGEASVIRAVLDAAPDLPAVALSRGREAATPETTDAMGFGEHLYLPLMREGLDAALSRVVALGAARAMPQSGLLTPAPSVRPSPRISGKRLLLAEDNRINQRVARLMLENLGAEVRTAENGAEAIEIFKAWRPDIVLMDNQMPRVDGLEATRQIRKWEEGAGHPRTPIIAITANALVGDRDRCIEAGMDDYVTKPLRAHTLVMALEAVVEPGPGLEVPLVDHSIRDELLSYESPELEGIYDAFAEDVGRRLARLREHVAEGNLKEARALCHNLKGAAASIGYARLAERAAGLERLCRGGELPSPRQLEDLEALIAETLAYVETL